MKRIRLIVISALVATLLIWGSSQKGIAQQPVQEHIKAVYEATAESTNVPLLVPSAIPLNSPAAPTQYWADSIAPKPDAYVISFDRASDCTGVMECSFASVRGELATQSFYNYQQLLSQPGHEEILLSDGTRALFSPHQGMGTYTPSSVYVQKGEYLYTFRIYMADKADVVAMANSATAAYDR